MGQDRGEARREVGSDFDFEPDGTYHRAPLRAESVSIPSSLSISQTLAAGLSGDRCLRGTFTEAEFSRLAPMLAERGFAIAAEVRLDQDIAGRLWLRGWLKAPLSLHCQRCEQDYHWPLALDLNLQLVASENEEQEALRDSDTVLAAEDRFPLLQVLEDEVLLALPMLARCGACENAVLAEPQAEVPARENPFAALLGSTRRG